MRLNELVIPVCGALYAWPVPDYTEELFAGRDKLTQRVVLVAEASEDPEVVMHYSGAPHRHHNMVASRVAGDFVTLDEPISGIAVITATRDGAQVPVPENVVTAVRAIASVIHPPPYEGVSPDVHVSREAQERARAMLNARGREEITDPCLLIQAAVEDLLRYAEVLSGWRNASRAGSIIVHVIASLAERTDEDMATIYLPGLRNRRAHGFIDEAAFIIGELITLAEHNHDADPAQHGFALLTESISNHMLNRPPAEPNDDPLGAVIRALGARLAAVLHDTETALGPRGVLDIMCWAIDHPADPTV